MDVVVEPEYNPQAIIDYYSLGVQTGRNNECKDLIMKAKQHLTAIGWTFFYIWKRPTHRELRYRSPTGKLYISLRTACKGCMDEQSISVTPTNGLILDDKKIEVEGITEQNNKRKKKEDLLIGNRPRKQIRKVEENSNSNLNSSVSLPHRPKCVLSVLIKKNIVLSGAKVQYRSKKDGRIMAEGQISNNGIICNCCQECFTLTNFEAHAGSTNHRPAAHIFLEDRRSLFDCQLQLKRNKNNKRVVEPTNLNAENSNLLDLGLLNSFLNDDICLVCHNGGDLILCDSCPSSFHLGCLGLEEFPDEENWFCPSCCCKICGDGQIGKFRLDSHEQDQVKCEQCEHLFHTYCLSIKGISTHISNKHWFCSKNCENISLGLREVLGKRVDLGVGNLTWTLLKLDLDADDIEEMNKNCVKLNESLKLIHDSFEPVSHPWTKRDVIADVIFSRFSSVKRLNFRRFYTLVLEREDEVITAATVRVHDMKVAEIPLIATKFGYRRLGMCRVLINELENKLAELGVEKLVLPAVPSMMDTWTGNFGFSKMTESERRSLLEYTLLDFPGTIMCQKMLAKANLPSIDDISIGSDELLGYFPFMQTA